MSRTSPRWRTMFLIVTAVNGLYQLGFGLQLLFAPASFYSAFELPGDVSDFVVVTRILGLVELHVAAVAAMSIRATHRGEPLGPILGIALGLLFVATGTLVFGHAPLGPVLFDFLRGALAVLGSWVLLSPLPPNGP